jgi:hypothetical protein
MHMRTEAVQKLVGKPVRDIYGRYAGYVVGFSVDTNGELQFVGIDQGNGEFTEFDGRRVIQDKDSIVVIPAWRVETETLRKEIEVVRKRVQALETLAKDGEITPAIYQQMCDQYNRQLKSLQETHSSLVQELTERLDQLERKGESLDAFLANTKVQFRAGEIDEGTYKVASEYCTSMRAKDAKEKEEIQAILRALTQAAAPTVSEVVSKAKPQVQVEAAAKQ